MPLLYLFIALAIAAFLYSRYRKQSADSAAAAAYFLNIKPALEKFGFLGEEQNVIEEGRFIDSLYYLRDFQKASNQLKGVSKINGQSFIAFWNAHRDGDQDPFADTIWNRYSIAFMPSVANGRNKAILSLKVIDSQAKGKLAAFGTDLTVCIAPLHFFNETNLRQIMTRMMFDIEQYETEGQVEQKWLIYGIQPNGEERTSTCCGLPLVYPQKTKPLNKSFKAAQSCLRDGYRS